MLCSPFAICSCEQSAFSRTSGRVKDQPRKAWPTSSASLFGATSLLAATLTLLRAVCHKSPRLLAISGLLVRNVAQSIVSGVD